MTKPNKQPIEWSWAIRGGHVEKWLWYADIEIHWHGLKTREGKQRQVTWGYIRERYNGTK